MVGLGNGEYFIPSAVFPHKTSPGSHRQGHPTPPTLVETLEAALLVVLQPPEVLHPLTEPVGRPPRGHTPKPLTPHPRIVTWNANDGQKTQAKRTERGEGRVVFHLFSGQSLLKTSHHPPGGSRRCTLFFSIHFLYKTTKSSFFDACGAGHFSSLLLSFAQWGSCQSLPVAGELPPLSNCTSRHHHRTLSVCRTLV